MVIGSCWMLDSDSDLGLGEMWRGEFRTEWRRALIIVIDPQASGLTGHPLSESDSMIDHVFNLSRPETPRQLITPPPSLAQ